MTMPVHERRQHFRIDDNVYFNYVVVQNSSSISDKHIRDELLGMTGKRFTETNQYFETLEQELSEISSQLSLKDPMLAHYLNLLNAKIDHLAHQMLVGDKMQVQRVNLSLGGMAFNCKDNLPDGTLLKIVLYTKPKMTPILIDAKVLTDKQMSVHQHRVAVIFENMSLESEQLLSQHIMLAQIRNREE